MKQEQYQEIYNYIETLTEEELQNILFEIVQQDPDEFVEHFIYYEYLH